jgi:uncharacterized protein (TIGR03086 family)
VQGYPNPGVPNPCRVRRVPIVLASMNTIDIYSRAQDCFDTVLRAVGPAQWNTVSECPEWTVRDVAGHLIWGQEQLRHWALGADYADRTGAPGAPHPGAMAGDDPVATWRDARERSVATLTEENLARMIALPGVGDIPVRAMVVTFVTDQLAHAWDIGHAIGLKVPIDADLVEFSLAWAANGVLRAPGFFGPELTPPAGADEQTRWLALLGRAA